MAITLRRNIGQALTFDQLDDNFADFTTFRGKFDESQWVGSNDGKLLYFNVTTGKVELKSLSSDDLLSGFSTNFTNSFATKNTDELSEGSTNLYYTPARANSDFDIRIATKSTTDLSEGSRLYYTDARADARIVAAGSTNWNTAYSWGDHANQNYLTNISSQTIGTLSDVDVTGASNGKILKYNGSQWVVANDDNSSNSITLTDLSVGAELAASGDGGITYNNTTGVFAYTPPDLSNYLTDITTQNLTTLADVDVTSATNGQVLKYTASTATWEPQDDAGMVAVALTDISDVIITAPTSGQVLQYNGSGWVNSTSGAIPTDTDDLAEGSTNLYYTDTRFDTRLGTKTTADLTEGTNLYYTDARARAAISEGSTQLSYNSSTGVMTFIQGSTDTVSEGSTNLYYTDARVDAHLNQSNPTSGYVLSWNGTDYAWVAQSGGAGITDGDKGDITVSSSGAVWTIDNDSINADKIANDAVGIIELSATGTPSSSTYLRGDNTWATISGGTPAGADTQVQFNSSGSFGADADFTYNSTTNTLTVVNLVASSIAPPSTLTGTYSITSPTTITLDPTDEIINDAPMKLVSKTVSQLGSLVSSAGAMVYCTDESGGAIPAFYDGTNWRRVSDRAIVS